MLLLPGIPRQAIVNTRLLDVLACHTPWAIEFDHDAKYAWIGAMEYLLDKANPLTGYQIGTGTVLRLDLNRWQIASSVPLSTTPTAMALQDHDLWVMDWSEKRLIVVDTQVGESVARGSYGTRDSGLSLLSQAPSYVQPHRPTKCVVFRDGGSLRAAARRGADVVCTELYALQDGGWLRGLDVDQTTGNVYIADDKGWVRCLEVK